MTQPYLAGELSLLLWELQAATTNEASLVEVAHRRQRAETGSRSALASVAVRALDVADWVCWDSLTRGDATAFIRQSEVCAELWEFGVCAGLLVKNARCRTPTPARTEPLLRRARLAVREGHGDDLHRDRPLHEGVPRHPAENPGTRRHVVARQPVLSHEPAVAAAERETPPRRSSRRCRPWPDRDAASRCPAPSTRGRRWSLFDRVDGGQPAFSCRGESQEDERHWPSMVPSVRT